MHVRDWIYTPDRLCKDKEVNPMIVKGTNHMTTSRKILLLKSWILSGNNLLEFESWKYVIIQNTTRSTGGVYQL